MRSSVIAGLGLMLVWSGDVSGQSTRTPAASSGRFGFFSDFHTNLNDALMAAGTARAFRRPESPVAGADSACFARQAPSVRAGWNRAVDYYAEIVSRAEFNDRPQYLLRMDLAGFHDQVADSAARQFVSIAAGLRQAAIPAYRSCLWAAQDAKNRKWIDGAVALLAAHEAGIVSRLEALYYKPWPKGRIPVDVVDVVSWSGANSVFWNGGSSGHLLVSPAYKDNAALEIVFHEASHGMMFTTDSVRLALAAAAAKAQHQLDRDLWHVILFYTTGQVVKRSLEAAGSPQYRPLVYGIFDRGTWVAMRDPVEQVWTAYVAGTMKLDDAAAALVDRLRRR